MWAHFTVLCDRSLGTPECKGLKSNSQVQEASLALAASPQVNILIPVRKTCGEVCKLGAWEICLYCCSELINGVKPWFLINTRIKATTINRWKGDYLGRERGFQSSNSSMIYWMQHRCVQHGCGMSVQGVLFIPQWCWPMDYWVSNNNTHTYINFFGGCVYCFTTGDKIVEILGDLNFFFFLLFCWFFFYFLLIFFRVFFLPYALLLYEAKQKIQHKTSYAVTKCLPSIFWNYIYHLKLRKMIIVWETEQESKLLV